MKKKSPMTLRKLLMLMAVVSLLLVSLAGCINNQASEDPSGDSTDIQTDPTDMTDAPTDPTEPEETDPVVVMGTVTHDNLNVRSNPSTDSTILIRLKINTRVVIIEQKIVGDVTWGRISDGWINMNYVLLDGEEPVDPTDPVDDPTEPGSTDGTPGTVTASELHIRKSNSASSDSVGKYKKGDKVVILEVKGTWGRTDKGWVSMKYIQTEGTTETPDLDNDKESATLVTDGKTSVLGYVIIDTDALYVRYGPGTKYDVADKVYEGEKVAYYQEKDGWLRIKSGWISKAYTEKDEPLSDKEASTLVTDGKTTVLGYVIIDTDSLNVRYGPGTKYDKSGTVSEGDRVAYYQEKNGWIRIKDGWISKAYTEKDSSDTDKDDTMVTDKSTKVLGYGVITASELNVRYGPGTKYDKSDEFSKGDRVAYYQKDGNWIRTEDGWISLNYVYVEGDKGDGAGSGTITGDGLNVRSGPGTDFKSVDSMNSGDKVNILVQIKVGKTTWGYTGKGWVSMDYVKMN